MKLGKKPARPGAFRLRLRDYLVTLPTPPAEFGHDGLVATDWGMLGNDRVGDCVLAGGAHETMLWTAEGGAPASFNDAGVLADYSAITGYNPADPSTDQGTDMQQAAAYRRATGLIDAAGNRHKVAAYLAITAGDLNEHLVAAYVFGAVGVGITFPDSAMAQFNAGQPWDVVAGSTIEGGHYVPLVASRGGLLQFVTWGKLQAATPAFFQANNDESVVYLSEETLANGVDLEGFNLDQLRADLAALAPAA